MIFCILSNFLKKLLSWGISQNMNKVIPTTDWPSEWQTENTSNVNISKYSVFYHTWTYLTWMIFCILSNFLKKLLSWGISQYMNTVILTDRVNDKLKIQQTWTNKIEIFFIKQSNSYNLYFVWYFRKTKKGYWVNMWICE